MKKISSIKVKTIKKNNIIDIESTDIESTDIESNISIPVLTTTDNKKKSNNIKVNSNNNKEMPKINKKDSTNNNKKDSTNNNKKDSTNNKKEMPKINKISESIYDRPELTYTDKLSKIQIQDLLVDYEQVKNVDELSAIQPGTHLRYFQMVDSKLKFRTGGILTVKTGLPAYVILSSGKVSWSVQVLECIFFKRITIKQVKTEYNKLLEEKQRDVISLTNLVRTQADEINRLKKIIKENNIKI